ncbi:MAG: NAD(P)/FAD-dependent oxidoreductase [Mycobacteriaceae bacterium]|nr:NAD(P)/FAD-dependent oxidoreductase [Mycobacteriaceae bacterium]
MESVSSGKSNERLDVVVVGSGPNGLAAAVIFAAAGLSVEVVESQPGPGGGCRTVELDLSVPLRHDLCSAVHPMAAASEFFERFGLTERGVELAQPEAAYAHPLDGGRAAIAYPSLDRTVAELGDDDGRLFRRVMAPLVEAVTAVRDLGLSDMRRVPATALTPRGSIAAVSMAGRALQLGTPLWERTTNAPLCGALVTGVQAHANTVIPSLAGGAAALLLGALAHSHGWPIPVGGSQSITDALIADLSAHGGIVSCGRHIERAADLPPARVYVFDTSPWTLARVFGDRLSPRYRRALARFRPGSGVAKVDFVVSEPIPWADKRVGLAGTVHVGGDRAQMAQAEKDAAAGRHNDAPMVLLSAPTVVDHTRKGPGGEAPVWTYAHVPNGSPRDMTDIVTAQIERFAPGFRDVVVGSRCIPASDLARHNANYVGGDIAAGQISMYRMAARPALKWDPYRTSIDNVYLCSASTPPGPAVHGMCGMYAATRVLRQQFGIRTLPDLRQRAARRSGHSSA